MFSTMTTTPAAKNTSYRTRNDPRTGEKFYEHRAMAELKLGRPLLPGEVVHHADENKGDSHPDNLWIFSSQSGHMIYHNYVWQEARGKVHLFGVEEVLRVRGVTWVT